MKQILVHTHTLQTQVAVMEEGELQEYWALSRGDQPAVGNIYAGRVAEVIPAMQAAFVDIGWEKNAYLHINDIVTPAQRDGGETGKKPSIRRLVQSGQKIMVQVTKEAVDEKAPRVTTRIALTGRSLVYQPLGQGVTLSRKIQSDTARKNLQRLAEDLLEENEGVIVRTRAAQAKEEEIRGELSALRKQWDAIQECFAREKTPALLHREADELIRWLRDEPADVVTSVLFDNADEYRRVMRDLETLHPAMARKLQLEWDKRSLFDKYGVDQQLAQVLERRVQLANGGFLVVDQTEALTVIDVNTGKFTGQGVHDMEATAFRMNCEAVIEAARQMRLRDLGGIILIDLIDMKEEAHRQGVLELLRRELQKDRTATMVFGITRLGLVEMTRKRIRNSLFRRMTEECPTCRGSGRVISAEEGTIRLERELVQRNKIAEAEAFVIAVAPQWKEDARKWLIAMEERLQEGYGIQVFWKSDPNVSYGSWSILYAGTREEARSRWESKESIGNS